MFRLTQYMRELVHPTPVRRRSGPVKPVVIWNLTRTCNLRCRHCYTTSADVPFPGELSHEQAMGVLDDLSGFGIPALILSGGEPLSRFDFFPLAERARELGFRHLSLSTNGTRVAENIDRLADLAFDYVGISLDGVGQMNDWFRGVEGAFDAALAGVRACKARGVKVGLRFTITEDNAGMLPAMLDLCDSEGVDKFYLSHLVYAGRGDKNRGEDTAHARTRAAMDQLIDRAWAAVAEGAPLEIVTGNNDADAVWFLRWVERNFPKQRAEHLVAHLSAWGGELLWPRSGQYRSAGQGAPRYLLVGLYRGLGEGHALQRALDRGRSDAGDPSPAPKALEGPLRRLRLQGDLRRQYPHPGPCKSPATPGPRIRPATLRIPILGLKMPTGSPSRLSGGKAMIRRIASFSIAALAAAPFWPSRTVRKSMPSFAPRAMPRPGLAARVRH